MSDLIDRQAAIDALDEIRHALWEIDIPSPTVPEYVEHHEQVQSVWKLLDKKQKELYALLSAQPERTGRWIPANPDGVLSYSEAYAECDQCHKVSYLGWHDEFCRHCGAKMEVEHE